MKKVSILIGTAPKVKRVKYYLELFNNQTNKDFQIILLSKNEINSKNFDFEFQWIEERTQKFLPNIRKMRHSIYKNELLLTIKNNPTKYILFFDGLQIPSKNLIEEHLKYLCKNFCVVGSRIEIDNKAEDWKIGDHFIHKKADIRDVGLLRRINGGSSWDCNASACYSDLIEINGYDMTFGGGGGGEDCDRAIRLERLGCNFIFNPRAQMFHPNHDFVKKTYASTARTRELEPTHHFPYHFRSSPWDPSTNGDDALLEDEYLKCYYDEHGIKRWKCKKCGEEGIIDSMHLFQYNEKHDVIVSPFGLSSLRKWLNSL